MRDSTKTKIWAALFLLVAVAGEFLDWSWAGFFLLLSAWMYWNGKHDFIKEELAEIKERLPR